MFVNPEVALESLPSADALDWLALDPAFVRCQQAKALLRWAVVAIVAGVASGMALVVDTQAPELELILAGWGVIVLFAARALVWPLLDVPRRGYVVRDKDLVYKAGVLWRSVKAVPYNRVQHAETASGPVDRRYGLARLTVFTAGGSGGDLRIDGLSSDVAERLRAHIAAKLGEAPSTAKRDAVDRDGRECGAFSTESP
ncbi:MAG: PH domain-containing protein [Gammaproteobacteria bacterium]|nr:PH domain-containing protein [Gammaproteobacteria bacterium]